MSIIIITGKNCKACKKVKETLKRYNADYTEYKIEDTATSESYGRYIRSLPTVFFNIDEPIIIEGNSEEIEEVLICLAGI